MNTSFVVFVISLMIFTNVEADDKSVIACALPVAIGPCRMSDVNYYYDGNTKKCKIFVYGGCQGNDNRFRTKDACERLCL